MIGWSSRVGDCYDRRVRIVVRVGLIVTVGLRLIHGVGDWHLLGHEVWLSLSYSKELRDGLKDCLSLGQDNCLSLSTVGQSSHEEAAETSHNHYEEQ